MNDNLTFSISRSTGTVAVGKVVGMALISMILGIWLASVNGGKAQAAKQMTQEEFSKTFESYRSGAISGAYPAWMFSLVFFLFGVPLFVTYEVLGVLLGIGISRLVPRNRNGTGSGQPSPPAT